MGGVATCCVWLQRVSERVPSEIGKLIAFFLSVPFFKASHMCFKFAYTFNQRRLFLLCGEDFFLQFYDRRIATGSIVDVLQSLRYIKCGFDGAQASECFTYHDVPSSV